MLASEKQTASLVELFHQGKKMIYKKGEFIIRPGETPPGVLFVEDGLVKAYDITKYGEENLLVIRQKGEILALTWAITGEDRNIIYTALEPTTVYCLSRQKFYDSIQSDPKISFPIVDMVTNMYRMHSERILNLEYRTVRERLISYLLTCADRFGKKDPATGQILLIAPLKQQDIASSINATRETTGRQLAYLERSNLICKENGYIKLLNPEKMQDYL
jgi:CRP-like cAMP-binding protein